MAKLEIKDDRDRSLTFFTTPTRVVSLVPSDTLTMCDLGCASALVGRTDYCTRPAEIVARVPSVGGTKNPRIDEILALAPDLVLTNQEENTRGDLERLAQAGVRLLVAFPKRVIDGLGQLARLARVMGVASDPDVKNLVKAGYEALREANQASAGRASIGVFCPIWMDPLMTIHGDTFISDMLGVAGASNVFADRERRYPLAADLGRARAKAGESLGGRDTRYPRVTLDELIARAPDLVLLPDEPHPFSEKDADVFRGLDIPAARTGAILLTDGQDLCWYGSQSVTGIARVRALVNRYRMS